MTQPGVIDVRRLLAEALPNYHVHHVATLPEGCDHVAYEVNGELIVRFSKDGDPVRRAEAVAREARLLDAVERLSSLAVPQPAFTVRELGCLAYFEVPGLPLLEVPGRQRAAHAPSIGAALGQFLAGLHATPVTRMEGLVGTDVRPLLEWRREAAETYRAIRARVPTRVTRSVAAFLEAPPPEESGATVFSHNDLGIEHVVVDPRLRSVTGIIDWSDAGFVDPAYDFGLIHRDLGPAALDRALREYPAGGPALRERAVFFARCTVWEELAYGVRAGRRSYVDKSLTAMAWLFSD